MKIRTLSSNEIRDGFYSIDQNSIATTQQQQQSDFEGFHCGVRMFERGVSWISGQEKGMVDAGWSWREKLHIQEVHAAGLRGTTDPANGGPGGSMGDAAAALPPVAAGSTAPDLCRCEGTPNTFVDGNGKTCCVICGLWAARCAVKPAADLCSCIARAGIVLRKDKGWVCTRCEKPKRADVTAGVEATMAISAPEPAARPEPRVQAEHPLNLADRSFGTLSALTVLAASAPIPPAEWGNEITTPGEQPDRYASWAVAWATKLIERSELELAKRAMAQSAACKAYGIKPKAPEYDRILKHLTKLAQWPPADSEVPKQQQQRIVVNIANLPLVRTGQGDYTVDFYG